MKLKYDFPKEVRLLYLGHWRCFLCGSNGTTKGGLEIHHILGRVSDSAFNSSCLCRQCHAGICHNDGEHQTIFFQTLTYLKSINYKPSEKDWAFLEEHIKELVGNNKNQLLELL